MIGRPHEELPAQDDALIGQNLKNTTKQAALGFAVHGQVAFGADGIFARRIQRDRRNQLAPEVGVWVTVAFQIVFIEVRLHELIGKHKALDGDPHIDGIRAEVNHAVRAFAALGGNFFQGRIGIEANP
jgi:hypothetical protein